MGGFSRRSFKLFKSLCGEKTFKNVAIVTTMWDKVTLEEGKAREMQLGTSAQFFKPALDEQAIMLRHNNTVESARDVIRRIFANHPVPLVVQEEMVDDKILLPNTNVGKELTKDLQKSAQQFCMNIENTRDEIVRKKDEKSTQELEAELYKSYADLARAQNELKNLRAYMVSGIDVEREWNNMHESAKLATLFRRSLGAPEAPEVDMFWSALGDTTKTVSEIRAVFSRYPLPSNLREQLLKDASSLDKDALKPWIKAHPEECRAMKAIMKSRMKAKRSLNLRCLFGWPWV